MRLDDDYGNWRVIQEVITYSAGTPIVTRRAVWQGTNCPLYAEVGSMEHQGRLGTWSEGNSVVTKHLEERFYRDGKRLWEYRVDPRLRIMLGLLPCEEECARMLPEWRYAVHRYNEFYGGRAIVLQRISFGMGNIENKETWVLLTLDPHCGREVRHETKLSEYLSFRPYLQRVIMSMGEVRIMRNNA